MNSRESACLTNFLLSGKCVLLELGHLPNESIVNINDYGDQRALNTSETSDVSSPSTINRLFSHMIISHNQELMIHAIAFGTTNPMSKIGASYTVAEEAENLSLSEFDELSDDIDDETLEKDLRVEVKIDLSSLSTLSAFQLEFHQSDSNDNTLSARDNDQWQNSH